MSGDYKRQASSLTILDCLKRPEKVTSGVAEADVIVSVEEARFFDVTPGSKRRRFPRCNHCNSENVPRAWREVYFPSGLQYRVRDEPMFWHFGAVFCSNACLEMFDCKKLYQPFVMNVTEITSGSRNRTYFVK